MTAHETQAQCGSLTMENPGECQEQSALYTSCANQCPTLFTIQLSDSRKCKVLVDRDSTEDWISESFGEELRLQVCSSGHSWVQWGIRRGSYGIYDIARIATGEPPFDVLLGSWSARQLGLLELLVHGHFEQETSAYRPHLIASRAFKHGLLWSVFRGGKSYYDEDSIPYVNGPPYSKPIEVLRPLPKSKLGSVERHKWTGDITTAAPVIQGNQTASNGGQVNINSTININIFCADEVPEVLERLIRSLGQGSVPINLSAFDHSLQLPGPSTMQGLEDMAPAFDRLSQPAKSRKEVIRAEPIEQRRPSCGENTTKHETNLLMEAPVTKNTRKNTERKKPDRGRQSGETTKAHTSPRRSTRQRRKPQQIKA